MRRWYLLAVPAVLVVAVLVTAAVVGARGHHKPPRCKSAISTIRVVGDHTEHGPVVWFPKGCRHD